MDTATDQPKLEQISDELAGPLLRYLTRFVGDRALAEDLLQETFIRIARGLPGFERRSSVTTWAFSIATHVAADHFRNPANRVRVVPLEEPAALPEAAPEIEERLVIGEMNACIRQVIDSLPEDYRAALLLHDLEGMTAEQTAEISACSVAAAKIRIHRARGRLREALRRECDFYRDSGNVLRCDRKA